MSKLLAVLLLAISVTAQTKTDAKPAEVAGFHDVRPRLSDAQKVAIYQSDSQLNKALNALKATPEYQAFAKAQIAQQQAMQEAVKGIDMKKWQLGEDLEFTEVKK